MKIVVLTSSPHKKGTSNTLINEFVRGAEDSGKQLEIIDLAHIDKKVEINDELVTDVLSHQIKTRKESIAEFEKIPIHTFLPQFHKDEDIYPHQIQVLFG